LIRPNYSGEFGARVDASPLSARRQGHDGSLFSSPERRTVMLIPVISRVAARTSSSGRREPPSTSRRPATAATIPSPVESVRAEAGDEPEADDFSSAAPQGMTLAGAQAAYASN
jgi:hypothetical protein